MGYDVLLQSKNKEQICHISMSGQANKQAPWALNEGKK